MPASGLLWLGGAAFALAFACTPVIRFFAKRRGLMDHPTERSSHVVPTPRGGGLAIVFAQLVALVVLHFEGFLNIRELVALEIGGIGVAMVGFVDDRRSVAPLVRLLVHVAAGIVVVTMIGGIPVSGIFGAENRTVDQILGVVGIAWATNLFNFMDGIDGIAGAEAVFVSISAGAMVFLLGGDLGLTMIFVCLGMAALGFLMWNWPPASIFMGDVGSGFLGFMLAALSILTSHRMTFAVQVWPILGGVFLVDASVTLIRRILRGDKWHQAHRTHAYQHLAQLWRGHRPVTTLVCAINIFWLLPCAWYAASHPGFATFALVMAILPLMLGALWASAGKPQNLLDRR